MTKKRGAPLVLIYSSGIIIDVAVTAKLLEKFAANGGVLAIIYRFVQSQRDLQAQYDPDQRVSLSCSLLAYHEQRRLSQIEKTAQLAELDGFIRHIVDRQREVEKQLSLNSSKIAAASLQKRLP